MNYYISDTHFGHENIIKHDANNGCRRFSSIEEHDNLIIENWNRVVTPQDNIYILGDFSWLYARETEELIKKLNGAKFLIKGNHDRWCKDGACKKLFQGIYDYKTIQDGDKMVVMHIIRLCFIRVSTEEVFIYMDMCIKREKKSYSKTHVNIFLIQQIFR